MYNVQCHKVVKTHTESLYTCSIHPMVHGSIDTHRLRTECHPLNNRVHGGGGGGGGSSLLYTADLSGPMIPNI